jgi:hypothetical protein
MLKDVDVVPSTYSLWVGREDLISSPAMSTPYDNITEQKIGVFPLSPGGSVSEGPFAFLDNYVNTDSITGNTAPFLGTGSISFAYSPITYSTLHNNNNASYSYSSTARDTVHFSLTYLYCNGAAILANSLTRFTAVLQDPATVQLAWSTVNEKEGRQYQVQRSQDGQHFTTVATLPAAGALSGSGTADYMYDDHLPAGTSGKWYYRLQITDPAGNSYSAIKEIIVGMTKGGGISVYPNPAINFVDLTIDPGAGSGAGWQIALFAADGSQVQSGNYLPSHTIRIDFAHKLAAGVYFVQTTDLQGHQHFINRILIK